MGERGNLVAYPLASEDSLENGLPVDDLPRDGWFSIAMMTRGYQPNGMHVVVHQFWLTLLDIQKASWALLDAKNPP